MNRTASTATVLLAIAMPAIPPAIGDEPAAAIEREIAELRHRIQIDLADEDELLQRLDLGDRRIAELQGELRRIDSARARLAERIAERELADAAFEQALPGLRERLWRLAEAHHRLSQRGKVAVLLSLEDPAELQRTANQLARVSERLARELDEARARLAGGRENRAALLAERRRLEAVAADLGKGVADLQDSRRQRGEDLALLRRRIGENTQLVDGLKQRLAALERLVTGIAAPTAMAEYAPENQAPVSARRGQLTLPAAGRTAHRFQQRDPLSGVPSKGIFIETPEGADVRSVSGGQVVYSDWFRGFGLLLVVDHGEGFMSLYGNNSELLVSTGARVEEGAPIALAGSSGGRGRSGVYFEFRQGGAAVDPLLWCRPEPG